MPIDVPYREFAKRQHRMLAAYMAMVAWRNGVECIHISRESLLGFLGVEKLRQEREDWISEDMQTWFPNISFWQDPDKNGFYVESVSFSRVPLAELPLPPTPSETRTEQTFLDKYPTMQSFKNSPEMVGLYQTQLKDYLTPPSPSGSERLCFSKYVSGLPIPDHAVTEEVIASILNRVSIGLDSDAQLLTGLNNKTAN